MLRLTLLTQLRFANALHNGTCPEDEASLLQGMRASTPESDGILATAGETRDRCRGVMDGAPSSIGVAMYSSEVNVCEDFGVVDLHQSDFNDGTYIIRAPGIYRIMENVVMAPNTEHMMPAKDSTNYPMSDGYWLGFVAAIAVASDNVFLDLNEKSISMSQEFLMRQRFFSVIQLGERPFKAAVGPPQFARMQSEPFFASNVVISDGQLGVSAHMGVHGVDNDNIWIDHVRIQDFETGGVQLNGATNIHISNTEIGPSLGHSNSVSEVPGLATLSQAQLLLRIVEGEHLEDADEDAYVAFRDLRDSVERYIDQVLASGDIAESEQIFENPSGLPDGSSLYGIVFHAAKPAIHDFASCPQFDGEDSGNAFGPVTLRDVIVKDLQLQTDEVVSMQEGGRPVMGPAGDLLQIFRFQDDDGNYIANVLSEAQLALGRLKLAHTGGDADEVFRLFGATNIPAQVIAWSNGEGNFDSMRSQIGGEFVCQKDAMAHHNKGVVGVRIEYYNDVSLSKMQIQDLENVGMASEVTHCTGDDLTYSGNDARGLSMSFVSQVRAEDVYIHDISSPHGFSYGVEERTHVQYDSDGDYAVQFYVNRIGGDPSSGPHTGSHTALVGMLGSDS